jgi:sialic acid synthase SpsE
MTCVIAEVGSNHNRDLGRAVRLIDACAKAGATAVKLQVFKIDELFAPEVLARRPELAARRQWEFPLELLPALRETCDSAGIELGATPFSLWAVAELDASLDFFKVASYELLWLDLIRECASTGKPLLISTGMATLDEIGPAVEAAREAGCRDLTLLHCVSGYPTPPAQANLAAIATLRKNFGCKVGWSDHTSLPWVAERAVTRWGATAVELHVDLDGAGFEAGEHNWTPADLRAFTEALRREDGAGGGSGERDEQAADGDGVKQPMPIEGADVGWRADPADGLRPLASVRAGFTAE